MAKAALRLAGLPRRPGAPAAGRRDAEQVERAARRPRRAGFDARFAALVSHPHPELGAPPALPEGGLRIVALGGLGEIGRNMTVFEFGGRLLVVDCGVLFPEADQPGIDLILPDFDYIRERLDDDRGDRAHPRPRRPHRRGAVPAARAARHPARRLAADAGLRRGQARRAPHQAVHALVAGGRSASGWARSTASSSRSTTRSPTRWRSRSAPPPGWCCTPATSRWTSCRSTAGSPTSAVSPGSAPRASTCCCATPPTPRCLGS